MGYTILHNRQDATSRDFVAGLPEGEGHTIIEWYTDAAAVAEHMATIGVFPSAFPSVALRVPDVLVPEYVCSETGYTIAEHIEPAHWELVRCPASLAEVEAAEAAAAGA